MGSRGWRSTPVPPTSKKTATASSTAAPAVKRASFNNQVIRITTSPATSTCSVMVTRGSPQAIQGPQVKCVAGMLTTKWAAQYPQPLSSRACVHRARTGRGRSRKTSPTIPAAQKPIMPARLNAPCR